MRKLTEDECHKRLKGRSFRMVKYGGSSHSKCEFECNICLNTWVTDFCGVDSNKSGCLKCGIKKRVSIVKIPETELYSRLIGRGIEMIHYSGKVVGKSTFKCTACKHTWNSKFSAVDQGSGCPKCSREVVSAYMRLPAYELQNRLKGRGVEVVFYAGSVCRTDSIFRCSTCQHEWATTYSNVSSGRGCPKCNGGVLVPEKDRHNALTGMPLKMIEYADTAKGKSKFKCDLCSHIWCTEYGSVYRGSGCPACTKTGFNHIKPAWLYILLLDTAYGQCYGFGVTASLKDRMQYHKKNLKGMIDFVYPSLYFETGKEAKEIEDIWKSSPYKINLGIDGFKTECVLVNVETTKMIFENKKL